jgi:effector-binding domain-containing protein
MRVGIISLVLAVLVGIAAVLVLDRGEQTPIPSEATLSKPIQTPSEPALAPVPPAPPAPAISPKAGLAPPPLDPGTPDEVVMVSHPALIFRGQARWDDGYSALGQAFAKLREQSQKLGLKETGYPLAVFVETDDQGFKYEAELPVESLPAQRPADLPADLRFGVTPEGKAIRFVHRGAYDEIDSTYEAVSAYVDVKGFEVKDTLIEEYIEMGQDSSDMAIEVHIFVQPTK